MWPKLQILIGYAPCPPLLLLLLHRLDKQEDNFEHFNRLYSHIACSRL